LVDEQNSGRNYLVLVERISRLERDVVKVDAELDKANENLRGAREDLREARLSIHNLRESLEASTSLVKQTQGELEEARRQIASLKTELRIMAGLITASLIALIGLVVQHFGVP
jgi:chromosome segregation ATPase